jgi:DNA-binding response OmpR family regulator
MTAPTLTAHILVVDDVEKNTRLLADLLTAKGYRASTAGSGEQALEQIDAEAPDLVLLDVMMPGLSGYEVCQALRADPRHALLPVVLVTALDPATERVKGIAAGADDFLSKPINQAELLARVRSLLRVKTLQDEVLRLRAELAVWQKRFGSPVDAGVDSIPSPADAPGSDPVTARHAEPQS